LRFTGRESLIPSRELLSVDLGTKARILGDKEQRKVERSRVI
jgi:hypothetical protein